MQGAETIQVKIIAGRVSGRTRGAAARQEGDAPWEEVARVLIKNMNYASRN